MAADHHIALTIVTNQDGSLSATVANPGPVRPGTIVTWVIAAERLPQDSDIYIRFYEKDLDGVKVDVDGCITGSTFNHGIGGRGAAGTLGRLIQGNAKLTSRGTYSYEVRYTDAGGDRLLVEKEIVIEGEPEIIPTQITRRGESGVRLPARSASGVRPRAKSASRVKPAAKAAAQASARKPAAAKARKAKAAGKPKKTRR